MVLAPIARVNVPTRFPLLDLEARERAAKKSRTMDAEVEAATREEIERLRAAGLAKLRQHGSSLAEAAQRAQQLARQSNVVHESHSLAEQQQKFDSTLMIKWNPSVIQPNEDELTRVFEKYGLLEHVLLTSKKGKAPKAAVVAFTNIRSAVSVVCCPTVTTHAHSYAHVQAHAHAFSLLEAGRFTQLYQIGHGGYGLDTNIKI